MDDIGEAVAARAAILRGPNLSITATSYPFVETLQRSTDRHCRADPSRNFFLPIDRCTYASAMLYRLRASPRYAC
uniref:Uncharacterized protein n=1 Tax=Trichogramma kaykai TaxID=54128 RepID=A0ABD2X0X5_9HYME